MIHGAKNILMFELVRSDVTYVVVVQENPILTYRFQIICYNKNN